MRQRRPPEERRCIRSFEDGLAYLDIAAGEVAAGGIAISESDRDCIRAIGDLNGESDRPPIQLHITTHGRVITAKAKTRDSPPVRAVTRRLITEREVAQDVVTALGRLELESY